MRTKTEIVHELLNNHAISEEDAVVLLKDTSTIVVKEYVPVIPYIGQQPTVPQWPMTGPYTITCNSKDIN